MNPALAEAALELIGVPFRLHGRDRVTGLDCVGLVAEALKRCGRSITPPHGYAMRALDVAPMLALASSCGLVEADQNGAVVLARVHPLQPHLLITVPGGFVHAHAGLGRVTMLPQPLPWPVICQWNLAETKD